MGAPIPVDWGLSVSAGLYKISDIVIDGISTAMSQRSEFAQMIQRNGRASGGFIGRNASEEVR